MFVLQALDNSSPLWSPRNRLGSQRWMQFSTAKGTRIDGNSRAFVFDRGLCLLLLLVCSVVAMSAALGNRDCYPFVLRNVAGGVRCLQRDRIDAAMAMPRTLGSKLQRVVTSNDPVW